MPSQEDLNMLFASGQMGNMVGAGGGRNINDPGRRAYEAYQQAQAELERLKGTDPMQSFAPQYRVKPDSGEREYMVNGKWAKQSAWDDPEFQALVVEPWMEQERKRMADEHQKAIALAQERAGMAQYDYDDYQRRQQEIQRGGTLGSRSYRSPRPGGGQGGY